MMMTIILIFVALMLIELTHVFSLIEIHVQVADTLYMIIHTGFNRLF